MKSLFLFMMVSLDGYFEGVNHDLSWHNVDAEFNDYAIAQTKNVGTLLFGHRTYDLMANYWPSEPARQNDPVVADLMNRTPKIVFSRSLERVEETEHWKNVSLMREIDADEIRKLKQTSEKDLGLYGSNNLCVSLMEQGLIDEFRIMVNPVAIGKGTPLFFGLKDKYKLKLTDVKRFQSGNVLVTYISDKIK